jgi:hypothetical protein
MNRRSLMQELARHRAARVRAIAPRELALPGYRGRSDSFERAIGIVLWIAFFAVLIVASN